MSRPWECDVTAQVQPGANTIEVFVGRLRKKIGLDVIETVRGLGYRMSPPLGSA